MYQFHGLLCTLCSEPAATTIQLIKVVCVCVSNSSLLTDDKSFTINTDNTYNKKHAHHYDDLNSKRLINIHFAGVVVVVVAAVVVVVVNVTKH